MVIKKPLKFYSFLFLFYSMVIVAQSASPTSKNEWYTFYNRAVSNDGRWIFFTKTFDDGKREGVLFNTTKRKETNVINAGEFYLDNSYFVVLNADKELLIKNLVGQKDQIFENVSDFEYDAELEKLLFYQKGTLILVDLKNKQENKFFQVTGFKTIKGTPCTFLYGEHSVSLLNKITNVTYNFNTENLEISAFKAFPEQKEVILLLKKKEGYEVLNIDYFGKQMAPPRIIHFDKSMINFNFLDNDTILASKPLLSENQKNRDTVEVWSSHDKVLKPNLMNRYGNAQSFELVDISPKTRPRKSYSNFINDYYLVFGGDYILESSSLENDDFSTSNAEPCPKILLRNRSTDKIELEIDKVQCFYPFEKCRYLLYFKDKDWCLFDVDSHSTKNLTASADEKFFSIDRLNTKMPLPTDRPWFNADYSSFFLTSRDNIWRYSMEKKQLIKLTANTDINTTYKIMQDYNSDIEFFKWHQNMILSDQDLVLKISDINNELKEGLGILKKGRSIIVEELGSNLINNIQRSKGFITYVIQNANNPPKLISYALTKNIKKIVYSTLETPLPLDFPKTILREWINKRGEKTNTTVVLPPDYSPLKKYPAIVRIYEDEARRFKEFIYPTYYNSTGFNRILLAQQGYIVILPEMKYQQNRVGESIVESVEETLKEVESWYSVDPQNVGLIGHSFGGYETMEILTRSKLFKAAVSGSGIADIVSDYFTVHKDLRNSNISRYTNEQFGFSDSFYLLRKDYLANNPILHADYITTPLLLFSGKDDVHVEWRQSVEMFMALSSLKKETYLLLFPNDAHILVHRENQFESTNRISQWFNYYLKNKERPDWF
jgi:dienelactone hydrolase